MQQFRTTSDHYRFRRYSFFIVILYSIKDTDFVQIRFLGGKLGKAIAAEFEASTVGDLL
jgi:hypothetical protein